MSHAVNTTIAVDNEVLFQKLGNTWFIFTELEGDMVYSSLPNGIDPYSAKLELFQVIESHLKKVAKHYKNKPEIAA